MEDVEIQWRVTWFPPEVAKVTRQGTEDKVRQLADENSEWFPIVESREVRIGDWRIRKAIE